MVERRIHVPVRLHRPDTREGRELSRVDRPSHINVLGVTCSAYARSLPECNSHGAVRLTPGLVASPSVLNT